MSDSSLVKQEPSQRTPSLRELALEREIRLLEAAEKSQHPEIRQYALDQLRDQQHHVHKQESRVSSVAAFWVSGAGFVLATVLALYFYFFYPHALAVTLSKVVYFGAFIVMVVAFVFSDKLAASEAVKAVSDVLSITRDKLASSSEISKEAALPKGVGGALHSSLPAPKVDFDEPKE